MINSKTITYTVPSGKFPNSHNIIKLEADNLFDTWAHVKVEGLGGLEGHDITHDLNIFTDDLTNEIKGCLYGLTFYDTYYSTDWSDGHYIKIISIN